MDILDTIGEVPENVSKALIDDAPYSLPLLRRLQFMNFPGGKTPNSHILSMFYSKDAFTIAYLDFSRGPETECWLYSSYESPHHRPPSIQSTCESQVISILSHISSLEKSFVTSNGPRSTPRILLIGTLHEKILQFLQKQQRIQEETEPHFKFIFKTDELPPEKPLVDESLNYGRIRKSDIPLVLSRTAIPRKERTMTLLPSVAITFHNEPIAWGFLGPDGSLTSLHCEEEYRGKGLAKAVALKLFREYTPHFGLERLQHADVAVDNLRSQGVCKSLKGVSSWKVYW
ncbi:uncharacterized protein PAC_00456 [Phialocephala subalpina]|uniref:N-acetyltransferase domain-containing protein n=1 Tax=Phialocephala subalpina TaxID=576137 RepID=A0A1L7WCT4_9HELO|nr:uncharacterized protein PAC_00456 [Phialocephala subalpina]